MSQYTTLNYLADLAKLIDDIHYENYHIPALRHQERVTKRGYEDSSREPEQVISERDYIDAQEVRDYNTPEFLLRKDLSSDDVTRLNAVNEAFRIALRGKTIPQSLLRRALTQSQLQKFEGSLTQVTEQSELMYGYGMPHQLHEYNKKLNKADFAWRIFERTPTYKRGIPLLGKNNLNELESKAISLYEDALEYLEEIYTDSQSRNAGCIDISTLQMWMDRPLDFDAGTYRQVDTTIHAMPRVRGSRSAYAEDSGLPKLSKRLKRQYCALNALLVAGCDIAFVVPYKGVEVITEQQQKLLRDKLKKLKSH